MGQYNGSLAQLLKYSFGIIPEMQRLSSSVIAEMSYKCLLHSESKGELSEESGLFYLTGISGICAGFLSLHPNTDEKNALSFMLCLYSLSRSLETCRSEMDIKNEQEIRKLYSCLAGAVDPSRNTGCPSSFFLKNSEGLNFKIKAAMCMSEFCKLQLALLPSFPLIAHKLKKYIQFHIDLQSYKHCTESLKSMQLEAWSNNYLTRYREISCWEFCAAANSLLGISAMFISASDPGLSSIDVQLMDEACFPWLSGFEALLCTYVNARIIDNERPGIPAFYKNLKDFEERILFFASKAEEACIKLKDSNLYLTFIKLLAAMYLSDPEANFGMNKISSLNIINEILKGSRLYYSACKLLRSYFKF